MAKLSELSLEELYSRKITKSVEEIIIQKESFSQISTNWCGKVCKLNCKGPSNSLLNISRSVDVLIIQDHRAYDEPKFKRSGKLVEAKHKEIIKFLADKGLGKDISYQVTDLLKCPLTAADIKKNKPPTESVMLKCRPYLLDEIDRLKPKVIISLATPATKALGLKASNYGNRGEIMEYKGIPVVFSLHPRILIMLRQNSAGKFWGPDFFSIILRDFQKARRLIEGGLTVPNLEEALSRARQRIIIARDIGRVKDLCAQLLELAKAGKVLSYDTETTGLDPQAPDAKLITAQFGFKDEDGQYKSFVFPLWHKDNIWYDPNEAWEFIKLLLEDPSVKKIGHNMKFDVLYTYFTTGVRLQGVLFDTMLLLHSINSGVQGNYGLKQAVWDWLPETQLGGYEDRLPKLTKGLKEEESEEDEEDGSESD